MMLRNFRVPSASVSSVLLALAVISLAGCSSPQERAKNYYEHGLKLLAAHHNRRAEIEFLNAVKYDKKLLPAWRSLAQADELTHNWKNLVPALRNILELDPNDMTSRIKLGRLLLVAGAFDDALHLVNDVKEPASKNAELLALKGAILLKLKDSSAAVAAAKEALQVDPSNTGATLVLAADDLARDDAKGALDLLDNQTTAKSDDVAIELFKLRVLEKMHDLAQAEAVLQKLITLYPKEVGFKKSLIRLYISQHRDADAEKIQQSIVAADPKNVQAQLGLVELLKATGGPAAAHKQLAALIDGGGNVFSYRIALAQLNFTEGKVEDATASLKKLINDASSPEQTLTAQINLAEMYLRQKKIDAAEAVVSAILAKDARNVSGLKLRAAIRLERGQFEGAISDLRQALSAQPRDVNLMLMLASAYERSGSVDLAGKEFAEAMQASTFNPTVGLDYAAFLRRHGNVRQAEDTLTDLATRWPKNVQVLSALAQIRLARQEWSGAQAVAEAIKKLGTNPTVADELLGVALAGQHKFDESIAALKDGYLAAPTAPQPLDILVRTYILAHKIDEGISFVQSVLKSNPSNAQAYVLLGSLQLANKLPDQARQSFMSAIAKAPTNVIGYRALSDFYVLQKKYDDALKVVHDGLKVRPDDAVLRLSLATLLEVSGNYEGAITQYQEMLDKNLGSEIVINNLASLLADHRTDKASLNQAKTLAARLQKSPLPQFKDTVGWVDYRTGDYKTALPLLEAAAKALPKNALVQYHLGMTYAAVSESEKASAQFKLALTLAPNQDLEQKIHAAEAKIGGQ
jgi:tetratricopeptide (TPR) repeat protein